MSDVVAVILLVGITAYALFGGADFGAGFWDLIAGGADAGRAPRAVISHSIGPVWEANHVWLIFCLVVLWTGVLRGVRVDHAHAVRAAVARRARDRASADRASRSARRSTRTSSQRNFGAAFATSSVIVPYCMGAVAGAIASGRVPAGGKAGDPWTAGSTRPRSSAACSRSPCARTSRRSTWSGTPGGSATTTMVEYFRRRAVGRRDRRRRRRVRRHLRAARRRALRVRRPHVARAAAGDPLGALRHRLARAAARANHTGARASSRWARSRPSSSAGASRSSRTSSRRALKLSAAAAPDADARGRSSSCSSIAAVVILPSLGLLYCLDQRDLLETAGRSPTRWS